MKQRHFTISGSPHHSLAGSNDSAVSDRSSLVRSVPENLNEMKCEKRILTSGYDLNPESTKELDLC